MSNESLQKQEYSKSNFTEEGDMLKANSSKYSKASLPHPRMKELFSDKIFQYYFEAYFCSTNYTEFRNISDREKLNFMINLYFYISKDIPNADLFNMKELNTEEQVCNINGQILDRLQVLKDDNAKNKILQTIKQYDIKNASEIETMKDKFKAIIDKYKMDSIVYDKIIKQSINYNQTNVANTNTNMMLYDPQQSNHYGNTMNTYKSTFNKKQLKFTTMTPEITIPMHANEREHEGLLSTCTSTFQLRNHPKNSMVKIDYSKIQFEPIGPIEKGNFYRNYDHIKEIEYMPKQTIFISNSNRIQEDCSAHYIVNKAKALKSPNNSDFITHLNYKTLIKPKQLSVVNFNKNTRNSARNSAKNSAKTLATNNSVQSVYRTRSPYNKKKVNEKVIQDLFMMNMSMSERQFKKALKRKRVIGNNLNSDDKNDIVSKLFGNGDLSEDNLPDFISLNSNEIYKIAILLLESIHCEQQLRDLTKNHEKLQEKFSKQATILGKFKCDMRDKLNESRDFFQNNLIHSH